MLCCNPKENLCRRCSSTMPDKPRHPESPPSEEEVRAAVLAFQKGIEKERNFEFLVARFYGPVVRFLAQRRYSAQDRLDITQEVFLNVYRGLKDFRGDAKFGTWVFKIAVNTCNRYGRLKQPSDADPAREDLDDETLYARALPLLGGQLEELIARERSARLRRAITSLPEQMRRCVELNVYRDLRYPEIAALLGISVGTVKAHLFHARLRLRTCLIAEPDDAEESLGGSS